MKLSCQSLVVMLVVGVALFLCGDAYYKSGQTPGAVDPTESHEHEDELSEKIDAVEDRLDVFEKTIKAFDVGIVGKVEALEAKIDDQKNGCVQLYTDPLPPSNSDKEKRIICPESGPGESCEHDFVLSPQYIPDGGPKMSTCHFTCVARGDLTHQESESNVHLSPGREFVWAYRNQADRHRLWRSVIYDPKGYAFNVNDHLSFECRNSIPAAKKN
eukprot:895376_1